MAAQRRVSSKGLRGFVGGPAWGEGPPPQPLRLPDGETLMRSTTNYFPFERTDVYTLSVSVNRRVAKL
ncbi:MAG TPA: hypothetical protein QGF58_16610, partial [Myxococcota bacterium]|nr:hypothetical protein [Myxococcota bacterium]